MELIFEKMHGLGNDFVIFDQADQHAVEAITAQAAEIADRRRGIGCDQILIITKVAETDARLIILNSDGSRAEACGNGTRCVAEVMMRRLGKDHVAMISDGGTLEAWRSSQSEVSVNMGQPRFSWQEIPLRLETDPSALHLHDDLPAGMAVNIGNPHCVFVVPDAEMAPVAELGPVIETHPMFPEKTNVEFISLLDTDHIRMRVWERGAGITLACGSGATAAAIAAHQLGLTSHQVKVDLDGGRLMIDWGMDGAVMTGPTCHVFQGRLTLPLVPRKSFDTAKGQSS